MTIPNVEALPAIDLVKKEELPEVSCIYFAIDSEGVIQYIGRTINLNTRWKSHHRYQQLSALSGVRIAYLETAEDLLDEVEEALIEHFDPVLNGTRNKADKKQITVRVNEELLKRLKSRYDYLETDSEIIRLAMLFLDIQGSKQ